MSYLKSGAIAVGRGGISEKKALSVITYADGKKLIVAF